jgi:hypothetical protein
VRELHREVRLEIPAGAGVGGIRQDGDVEIAVRAMGTLSPGAEESQDGDSRQVADRPQDLLVEARHRGIVAESPAGAGLLNYRRGKGLGLTGS